MVAAGTEGRRPPLTTRQASGLVDVAAAEIADGGDVTLEHMLAAVRVVRRLFDVPPL